MPVRAVLLVLGASLVLATAAGAQDEEEEEYPVDPTLRGAYIGGALGVGWDNFDIPGDFGPSMLTSVIVGYRGSEYLSIETEFEWLNGFKLGPNENEQIDAWIASLGFRVHIPIGRIEPYLTYGGGILHVESRGTTLKGINSADFAIMGGGGVAFQVNDDLSLFTEGIYTWPVSSVSDYAHGSLRFGLLYKFGDE